MKMNIWIALESSVMGLSLVACVTLAGEPVRANPSAFRYDAAKGTCRNERGETGYNAPNPTAWFGNQPENTGTYLEGDAECVDFSGFDFSRYIGVRYAELKGWNFRGARFDEARFHFANIKAGDFAGADLRNLNYGYAKIEGRGDAFTRGGTCMVGADYAIRCWR